MDGLALQVLAEEETGCLERPLGKTEVQAVVKEMNVDRDLVSNVSYMDFFQGCWEGVKGT